MKNTKTEVIFTCDFCKSTDVVHNVEIPVSYSMDLVYSLQFKPYAYIPYATDHGHVCKKCLADALCKYLAKVK